MSMFSDFFSIDSTKEVVPGPATVISNDAKLQATIESDDIESDAKIVSLSRLFGFAAAAVQNDVVQADPAEIAPEVASQSGSAAPDESSSLGFDSEARYRGSVEFFSKLKGYGFIVMAEKGLVPNDKVFVHWRSIDTNDRYALLRKGMEVEFGIHIVEGGEIRHRAKQVSEVDGAPLQVQDSLDSEMKQFLGGENLRYTGRLKFYDPKAGYGYITLDPGFAIGLDGVDIRVERAEVNAGGMQPIWMTGLDVEFGIWATTKGALKAYNMTLLGNLPVTYAALESRVVDTSDEIYHGVVKVWNWKQGWGFIKPAQGTTFSLTVQEKLQHQAEVARKRATDRGKSDDPQEELLYFRKHDIERGCKVDRGTKVQFEVYTDNRGAGAQKVCLMKE